MTKKIFFYICILYCVLTPNTLLAKHLHKERIYQNKWAELHHAKTTEYVLPDKTRVDIITDEYAIEVDFAKKWAESVGQSLYYAAMTGLKPGIVIIVENINDYRFIFRLEVLTKKYDIKLWLIKPEDLKTRHR